MIKIKLERERFVDKLSKAYKFISDKQVIPAMDNFLFRIHPASQSMDIHATDGATDVKLECQISETTLKDTFEICIPAKLLLKTITLFRDTIVTINVKAENLIELVCGKSKFKISLDCPPASFPLIQHKAPVAEMVMNAGILKMGLMGAENFVDENTISTNFQGIQIAEIGSRIIFTGLTQALMCRVSMRPLSITSWKPIVIHVDTAQKISKLLNEDKTEISVSHSDDKIYFHGEGFYVTSSVATIKFPPTEGLFSKMPSNTLVMNTMDALQAVKRLKLYCGVDETPVINMSHNLGEDGQFDGHIKMVSQDSNVGNSGEELIDLLSEQGVPLSKRHFSDGLIKILTGITENEFIYHYAEGKNIPSFIVPKTSSDELNMFTYLIACLA